MVKPLADSPPVDRMFDPATHMWVQRVSPGTFRIGMDPLGIESSGTLAQLSLPESGTALVAGRAFGQLEAAKFVGPLVSPVTGRVALVNLAVVVDPGLAERDPFGDGWLIEAVVDDPDHGLAGLLSEPQEVVDWYQAKLKEYRRDGVIAR